MIYYFKQIYLYTTIVEIYSRNNHKYKVVICLTICYLEGESIWTALVHLEGVMSMIIKDCCCNIDGCIIYK